MAQLSKHARGFIQGVVSYIQKGKKADNQAFIPGLRKLLSKVSNDAQDDMTAHVYTAILLSTEEKSLIQTLLSKTSNRDITIVTHVAPTVLGGMKIQIRDWVVDMTFLKTVQTMSHMLME